MACGSREAGRARRGRVTRLWQRTGKELRRVVSLLRQRSKTISTARNARAVGGRVKDPNTDMIEGRLSSGRVRAEDHSVGSPGQ